MALTKNVLGLMTASLAFGSGALPASDASLTLRGLWKGFTENPVGYRLVPYDDMKPDESVG